MMAATRKSKPQSAHAISTHSLTKRYGKHRGIDRLNLDVAHGEVFGFLGPNGSGKSTTINLLMGFRRPTSGSATVLGHPVGPDAVVIRRRVGYMPGELALYERMHAHELLEYFGRLRGEVDQQGIRTLADRFGLDLSRQIGELSKGNKQKVALVAAWMNQPELLILDEPTSGLDPLMQQEFMALVRESTRAGATVFLSSHDLAEVEHLCDRAAIIKEGRLLAVERISDLHQKGGRRVEAVFTKTPPASILTKIPGVFDRTLDRRRLTATVHGPIDPVIKALAKHRLESLEIEHASLEQLFFQEYHEESA